jgi:hypothetical protein
VNGMSIGPRRLPAVAQKPLPIEIHSMVGICVPRPFDGASADGCAVGVNA